MANESNELKGATILVTGGTGSFGNRVAAYIDRFGPKEIRILSRDEKKQWDMRRAFPSYRYIIGDVRDEDSLEASVRGVDYIFHAAALKQVPSCELYPWEAMKTNTIGSLNVCTAAIRHGVRQVVALSTDKAVKPVNAMGMSKALMEKIVCTQNLHQTGTTFSCVRYGNVMGSRGSVIPLFRELLANRRPLTLTVPEMTRFLMTLDQSVDLVIHALTKSVGGEVFVRKAPACTVEHLAKVMATKYGGAEDYPIEVTGIRPGEKLHEVLVNEYEMTRAIESTDYFSIQPEYRPLADQVSTRPIGAEYTSENTTLLTTYDEVSNLLDAMGSIESFR